MSDCLNPDCVTDYPVMAWLDPVYCCDACRRAHCPISDRDPDLTCARKACPQVPEEPARNALGGYCSKTCIALDEPAPVEAWAAAMARMGEAWGVSVVDVEAAVPQMSAALPPAGAVEPLTPVPVGAETSQSVNDPVGPPWADIWPATLEAVDERHDYTTEELTALPDARTPDGLVEFVCTPPPRRWLARLLRRTA